MCGICGFVGEDSPEVLARMVESLHHRGPDGGGAWHAPGIALGMRRLAIVDIQDGAQPVFSEDGTVVAVFNGEIYNHMELRASLEARGYRFHSDHSDSEVIPHLYKEYGIDFLNHLNGMFSIAIWDSSINRLILARDHVGIKPLFYAHIYGNTIFGSEPKAILIHPKVSRDPDFSALHHYFSLKNVPAPATAFRDIRQLRPGCLAIVENGQLTEHRWWTPASTCDPLMSEADMADRVRTLLTDSVRLQMRADVPVGAYLSGGLDSSSVVALMGQSAGHGIKTFTLVYPGEASGKAADRRFAREVANRYGTEHHELPMEPGHLIDDIAPVLAAFDEPFSGVISTFFLTRLMRRHVTVALSGDGADELFGSYLAHRLAQPMAAVLNDHSLLEDRSPEAVRRLAPFSDDRERLQRLAAHGSEAGWRFALFLADEAEKRSLYTPMMRDAVGATSTFDLIQKHLRNLPTADPLNRILELDAATLLPDQVLAFVDRLSMAHSLEVRPPFLDPRMVEFAMGLPGHVKIRGGRVKHILKEAVRGLLPEDLIDRPKEGFVMPINDWMREQLRSFITQVLRPDRLAIHGLLDPAAVGALLARFNGGETSLNTRLWNIVCFQLWWEGRYGGV